MKDLSQGWVWTTLGEVCEVSPTDPTIPESSPFVPMSSVKVGARYPVSYETKGTRGGVRAQGNDILFARITPCLENGKVVQLPQNSPRTGGSTELVVVRPGVTTCPGYVYYWCLQPDVRNRAKHQMAGVTGRMRLSGKDLAAFDFPLPPLPEQHRIVEALEDHFSRLDAADVSTRRSILRLKALRNVALAEAVEQARFSPGVDITTIGELAKVSSGTTPLKSKRAFYEGGTIPWITSGDLHQGLITQASQFVTQAAVEETTLKTVPAGSILIAMYGEGKTRGTAAELGIEATTNQACAAIVLDNPELRPWVMMVLDANYSKIRRVAAGGVQPNLNLSIVKAIEIPIPAADLRTKLIERNASFTTSESRLRLALSSAMRRSAALRRSLLRAAFNGELVDHDPTDESADIALGRIRNQPKPTRMRAAGRATPSKA